MLNAYAVIDGLDGKRYAVFADSIAREDYSREYPHKFQHNPIACCEQYDNAYELSRDEAIDEIVDNCVDWR